MLFTVVAHDGVGAGWEGIVDVFQGVADGLIVDVKFAYKEVALLFLTLEYNIHDELRIKN
mgnify:CR=1 FL=1